MGPFGVGYIRVEGLGGGYHPACKEEGDLGGKEKTSRWGSVSGVPCEMAMGMRDSAYRWGGGVYKVVVAMGSCVRETRGGERVWAKNPKLSRHGSVSGALCQCRMVHRRGVVACARWWW
jgi:hypothetical protein